jgi:hypothetical protein
MMIGRIEYYYFLSISSHESYILFMSSMSRSLYTISSSVLFNKS